MSRPDAFNAWVPRTGEEVQTCGGVLMFLFLTHISPKTSPYAAFSDLRFQFDVLKVEASGARHLHEHKDPTSKVRPCTFFWYLNVLFGLLHWLPPSSFQPSGFASLRGALFAVTTTFRSHIHI